MFKVLVLQTLYTQSDDQTEYQIRDRLSFMRFIGLALHDPVPHATTIWLFREQLTRAGAIERLFRRFDAVLRAAGYLAMGGQIVDATIIQAQRPRRNGRRWTPTAAGPSSGAASDRRSGAGGTSGPRANS
jgi:transposase, IS5 family